MHLVPGTIFKKEIFKIMLVPGTNTGYSGKLKSEYLKKFYWIIPLSNPLWALRLQN
jgi:hypothetical protein